MKIDVVLVFTDETKDFFKSQLLKFVLRGIDRNISWIKDLYVVVPTFESLPEWVDKTKIKIITHEMIFYNLRLPFIDKIDIIEAYISLVLNISPLYLIIYDTTFILQPLKIQDYFNLKTEQPIFYTNLSLTKETTPRIAKVIQNYLYINNTSNIPKVIRRPTYGITPTNKQIWWSFFTEHANNFINNSLSYSSDIIVEYGKFKNIISISETPKAEGLFEFNPLWAGIIKYDLLNNNSREIISITNALTAHRHLPIELIPEAQQWILEGLEYRLGNTPSIYELK